MNALFIVRTGILIAAIIFSATTAGAKTQSSNRIQSNASVLLQNKTNSATAIKQFEQTLSSYFTGRSAGSIPAGAYRPTQQDYFSIVTHWQSLSQEFKTLYSAATAINNALDRSYRTPGGHFEIWYTLTGSNAVAPADLFGYGTDSTTWRNRTAGPNGVPDYVDHVGFAVDSSWNMEIKRFGFIEPYPYSDASHPSNLHKIMLVYLDPVTYAVTIPPGDQIVAGAPGYASYIEIRNNWNGNNWGGYQQYPEKAIRVTAAHEFFHCCQFRLVWQLTRNGGGLALDNFSNAWIEGSAVLMEELAFDSINDYIQYSSGYFDDPTAPMVHEQSAYVYSNGLVFMYLYQQFGGIDFIKNVFFNNYTQKLDFYTNLDSSAHAQNTSWNLMLGGFHAGSYFTGTRSGSPWFIADAAILDTTWNYTFDTPDAIGSIRKTIKPYGMQRFAFRYDPTQNDTLTISFAGQNIYPENWACNIILRNRLAAHDSLINVPVLAGGICSKEIINWDRYDTAITIITNAYAAAPLGATVTFSASNLFSSAGDTITQQIYCDSITRDSANNFSFTIAALAELRGKLRLSTASLSRAQRDSAYNHGLAVSIGCAYTALYQQAWIQNASIFGSLRLSRGIVENALAAAHFSNPRCLSVYLWNDGTLSWDSVPAIMTIDSTGYRWAFTATGPGQYALFASITAPLSITAYPNPIKRNQSIKIEGSPVYTIYEVSIVTLSGSTIASLQVKNNNANRALRSVPYGVVWNSTTMSGATAAPGTYFVLISYTDGPGQTLKTLVRKIMVLP